MEQQLAKNLSLDSAGATGPVSEVSQPVAMTGANAAQGSVVMQSLTATNVSCQLQESNDLENWSDKGSATTATAVGYKVLTAVTAISGAYVRMKYTITGSGKAILSCTLAVTQL